MFEIINGDVREKIKELKKKSEKEREYSIIKNNTT